MNISIIYRGWEKHKNAENNIQVGKKKKKKTNTENTVKE